MLAELVLCGCVLVYGATVTSILLGLWVARRNTLVVPDDLGDRVSFRLEGRHLVCLLDGEQVERVACGPMCAQAEPRRVAKARRRFIRSVSIAEAITSGPRQVSGGTGGEATCTRSSVVDPFRLEEGVPSRASDPPVFVFAGSYQQAEDVVGNLGRRRYIQGAHTLWGLRHIVVVECGTPWKHQRYAEIVSEFAAIRQKGGIVDRRTVRE